MEEREDHMIRINKSSGKTVFGTRNTAVAGNSL